MKPVLRTSVCAAIATATTVFATGGIATGALAQAPARAAPAVAAPAQPAVKPAMEVFSTMRDGVKLAADVYLPEGPGRRPVTS